MGTFGRAETPLIQYNCCDITDADAGVAVILRNSGKTSLIK